MGIFNIFKKKEIESCFKYVADMSEDAQKEINESIYMAQKNFNINTQNGKEIAYEIYKIVENILKTNSLPKPYTSLNELAIDLGVYYGYAICSYYNWTWKMLGFQNENDALVSIVSPNEYYSIQPMHYIQKILTRNNIGLYGQNDNTILLLFNMLETTYHGPEKQKHTPLH